MATSTPRLPVIGYLLSLLSLLALSQAAAQTPPPAPVAAEAAVPDAASEPPPVTAAPATTAPVVTPAALAEDRSARESRTAISVKLALTREDRAYGEVLSTYRTARRLFGERHVVLTAIALTGGRCKSGQLVWGCKDKLDHDTGVAGLVAIPLLGYGGSWGWDWFPVLQTENEAQAYQRFTQHARAYQRVAALATNITSEGRVPEEERVGAQELEQAFQRSAELLHDELVRARNDDKRYFKEADAMLGCLARLLASTDPLVRRQRQLDGLWEEYELLSGELPQRRHGFLLGPAAGIQVNDPFDYLYGVSAEVGRPWARVMLSFGLRATTSDVAFRPTGWYVGIGLSGELADDLVNLINGASTAASKL